MSEISPLFLLQISTAVANHLPAAGRANGHTWCAAAPSGREGDVSPPWVAGNQIAWDLIHTSQGNAPRRLRGSPLVAPPQQGDEYIGQAPRRLRLPVRLDYNSDNDDDDSGNPEPRAADFDLFTSREWYDDMTASYAAADYSLAYVTFGFGAGPALGEAIAALRETSAGEARERGCTVCLGDFEPGEALRRMPCSHSFHESCIFDWLRVSGVCPLCRHRLPIEEGQPAAWLQSPTRQINGVDVEQELGEM